jgi:hypothetical protein
MVEITSQEGIDKSHVSRMIMLAFLAPDITESIIAGRQPADLSVEKLTKRIDLPLDWVHQHHLLGFPKLTDKIRTEKITNIMALNCFRLASPVN